MNIKEASTMFYSSIDFTCMFIGIVAVIVACCLLLKWPNNFNSFRFQKLGKNGNGVRNRRLKKRHKRGMTSGKRWWWESIGGKSESMVYDSGLQRI